MNHEQRSAYGAGESGDVDGLESPGKSKLREIYERLEEAARKDEPSDGASEPEGSG